MNNFHLSLIRVTVAILFFHHGKCWGKSTVSVASPKMKRTAAECVCVSCAATGISTLSFVRRANKRMISPRHRPAHPVLFGLFHEFPNIADLPQNFSPWWKNKMAVDMQSPF